ncbi:indolepyruvate ferredoxin oxidoreductase family protein [Pseudooceanicola sp. CBS1P-1]|uniref:Indolepyruvate ferredoxin oxidoreductase family protein n=1 Tax=Pseudooceanicola albus TaxID=2692189 RepID=A0A6L7FZU6_9RHOB|nr:MULTISPECIES: indolepyruvate ferredoxin oxidoreductase family protein [Pseudooceanicola]MBT9383960.1 indolepyruvate ferredoxin oxidoreductase family protein [Pseudooceanicola endophyticus]MXN16627.1 indolepyruvate ferredoxin oxidoreductase family protein [Pseudooceanicola albus]
MSKPDTLSPKTARMAFLSGNQALAKLPVLMRQRDAAAGLNTAGYVTGYRGSPLAQLDREMMRQKKALAEEHIHFHPALNEDLAVTAAWGTQQTALFEGVRYDGVFAMWYGKGPGVDRSIDALRHANADGTNPHGGVLALMGDDHGAVSSTLPHQTEHDMIAAQIPVIAPAGVQDYLRFGLLGWEMSRAAGVWVGFKCQTEVVESSATVSLEGLMAPAVLPEIPENLSLRWPDGPFPKEARLEKKLRVAQDFARLNGLDESYGAGHARLGLIASGKSWLDLRAALGLLGLDEDDLAQYGIRLRKVGLVWPLEPEGLRAFADQCDEILVIEEKRPVIEDQLKSLLFNADPRPKVSGKTTPEGTALLSALGEQTPHMVARAILMRLPEDLRARIPARIEDAPAPKLKPLPEMNREPYFCSGCPHSISTRLPDGSRATTGIGCHMMVIGVEGRETSTFTQMGAEGISWLGLSPFTDEKHIFANMGDGTFFHSGLLAIRAAIAAQVNITYKILFNDAVAMTGGQPHDGELSVPKVVASVLAEGAREVVVVAEQPERHKGALPANVKVYHRDRLDEVQRHLREVEGTTVLVFDQVCAAEKRRRRKTGEFPKIDTRVFINDLVCEGCGDCSAQSGCISIEPKDTPLGRKREINQSSCNGDQSCLKGFCPSFVTIEGGTLRKPAVKRAEAAATPIPDPVVPAVDGVFSLLVAGIGGTGVLTVSQVLARAAHLDGLAVQSLDQTGLAQKNGAVVGHLRLARDPHALTAARVGEGEADLVLAFDMLVAQSAKVRPSIRAGRTQVVVDDRLAPNASFVQNTAMEFRKSSALKVLSGLVAEGACRPVAGTEMAVGLMGDAIATNLLILGTAWQAGLVPISLAALTKAIGGARGGEANLAAFDWGRRAFLDPKGVLAMAHEVVPAEAEPVEEMLEQFIARRASYLTGYQSGRYAKRYLKLVEATRRAEGDLGEDLTRAVATSAFRLMAYKDEYEVARLHLDASQKARIAETFEGDYKIRYHLAPPVISKPDGRTGRPAKRAFGAQMDRGFKVLKAMKVLRGTPLDPFGRTEERRMERALIADFEAEVQGLIAGLSPETHARAVQIAALPQMIRGFGPVKEASVTAYRAARAKLD